MGLFDYLIYKLLPEDGKKYIKQKELEKQTKLLKEQNKQLEYYKHRESLIKEQNERKID